MRIIKFRGKDLNGEWVYGDLHTLCDKPHIHTSPLGRSYINTDTIGQYTGVNDKHGREIYEGDIVQFFKMRLKVSWSDTTCSFILENDEMLLDLTEHNSRVCEIIGNIHDNPKLL